MSTELDGLKYALDLVKGRRVLRRNESYLAAIDELEIFLEAAIERVENGEPMHSIAFTQLGDPNDSCAGGSRT